MSFAQLWAKKLAGNAPEVLKVAWRRFETEIFAGAAGILSVPQAHGDVMAFLKNLCTAKSGCVVSPVAIMDRWSGGFLW